MSERDPNEIKGVAIFNQNLWEGRVNQRSVSYLSLEAAVQSLEAQGFRAGCENKGTNGNPLVVAAAPTEIENVKNTLSALGLGSARVVPLENLNTLAPAAADILGQGGNGIGCRAK